MRAALPPWRHVERCLTQLDSFLQFGMGQDVVTNLVQQIDARQATAGSLLRDWLHEDAVGRRGHCWAESEHGIIKRFKKFLPHATSQLQTTSTAATHA